MKDWHCYIHGEDDFQILTAEVQAESPEEAALLAASKIEADGWWTVIPAKPFSVHVVPQRKFEVASVENGAVA